MRKIAVGIDPSATSTGIAWPTGVKTVKGCKASAENETDTPSDWAHRIHDIVTEVVETVIGLDPQIVLIEEPPRKVSGRFVSAFAHERAGVYWGILCQLQQLGFTVAAVNNSKVKTVLSGDGKADKKQQLANARRFFPSITFKVHDEADAMALCAIGQHWIGADIGLFSEVHRESFPGAPWQPPKPKKAAPRKPKKKLQAEGLTT